MVVYYCDMNMLAGSDEGFDSFGFRTSGDEAMTDGYGGVVFGQQPAMRPSRLGQAANQPVAASQKLLRGPVGKKMISSKLIGGQKEPAPAAIGQPFVPGNPQPFVPETKGFISESRSFSPGPQPFVPEAQPFIPEPKPFVPEAKPFVPEAKPFVPEPKPFVPEAKPFVPEPKPFVPSPHKSPMSVRDSPVAQDSMAFERRSEMIEAGFATAMDRSMANLRRLFSNEFASIMRQQSSSRGFDVDEFTDTLSAEVSELIQTPVASIDVQIQTMNRRVAAAIDEHTKPVSSSLAEADARNSVAMDHHISELRQLQEELEGLKAVFKSGSDGIVQELEKERVNAATIRDAEQAKYRELEKRMRAIKLKQVELEAKNNHQNAEREGLDRLQKQFEQKKRIWEEESLPMIYDEGGALRQRILHELNELRNEVAKESFENLTKAIDDGLNIVKEEGDSLRSELMELELANRWMMTRARDTYRRSPTHGGSTSPRRGNVLSEAQTKLSQLRKQREEMMRNITTHDILL